MAAVRGSVVFGVLFAVLALCGSAHAQMSTGQVGPLSL